MKRLILLTLLCGTAFASASPPPASPTALVSVTAQGHDVRQILTDIFVQAKKSCVIQPSIQFPLYLSLQDTPFDQALGIICRQAHLIVLVKDGIFYISKAAATPPPAPRVEPARLPVSVLAKLITTRLHKTELKKVLASFTQQTGVRFELGANVPDYRLDAYLLNTSLKYALGRILVATGLESRFTDHMTILISAPPPEVSVVRH